jgi:hypothetical protein
LVLRLRGGMQIFVGHCFCMAFRSTTWSEAAILYIAVLSYGLSLLQR